MSFFGCLIVGCTPASLLTESISSLGFAKIQLHAWSILTNPSPPNSIDPQYCDCCYYMLTNISSNHEDTLLVFNRGLTISGDEYGVKGK